MMARWLAKNPLVLGLLMGAILVAGISSLAVLPRLEDPILTRRFAIASTVFPGADVGQVEALVTIPIEETLRGAPQVKRVRSNSRAGISNIVIELEEGVTEVVPVWADVQDRLDATSKDFPESCESSRLQVIPLKAYAAIIALRPIAGSASGSTFIRRHAHRLRSQVVSIAGTEQVDIFGDQNEEFVIEVQPEYLIEQGTSISALASQVSRQIDRLPAGGLPRSESNIAVGLSQTQDPITELQNVLIREKDQAKTRNPGAVNRTPRGKTKRLAQIASIQKRPRSSVSDLAWTGGQPSIVLGAMVSDDLRIDRWVKRLERELEQFRLSGNQGFETEVLFSQYQHVDRRMNDLLRNLGIGTIAVMVVVLVLMGWRSMMVVAIALPLSSSMVLAAMRAMEIPIHQMSVTGLIVALGLLIDNAIVMVDSVQSKRREGISSGDAITQSVRHFLVPLFGSTLTTALAFWPIAMLPGAAGEFVGTIAVSVILAITSSFLLAMTVIPALMGLLNVDVSSVRFFSDGIRVPQVRRGFEVALRGLFRAPLIGVLASLLLPAYGYWVAQTLPKQFFPPTDRSQLQVELELPTRSSIDATRESMEVVEALLRAHPEVDQQYWFVGRSAPTFYYNVLPRRLNAPSYAQAFIDIGESVKDPVGLVRSLQSELNESVPEARIIVRQLEQGPPFEAPIELRVFGDDLDTLREFGNQVRQVLSGTKHVVSTRSDLSESIPRLSLDVDDQAAIDLGLTPAMIAGSIYTSLEGAKAGTLYDRGRAIDVRVSVALTPGRALDEVAALPLGGSSGVAIPPTLPTDGGAQQNLASGSAVFSPTLGDVSQVRLDSDVGAIVRINGQRVNEIKAFIDAGVLPSVVIDEFRERWKQTGIVIPPGITMGLGGESEKRSEAVDQLVANGILLFSLILLTLLVSFQSFRCAAIVACVGGLSGGLGVLMLWVFGYPFGFMAILGCMGLIGIAINDSIVVLSELRTLENQNDSSAWVGAVIGCSRHVLATTLTTMVGFLPLLLGGGGFWPPLAIVISAGVLGATFLALVFTPCLHRILLREGDGQVT